MDFGKLMREQDMLVKGGVALMLPSKATLNESAELMKDQKEDLVYLVSDLTEENLGDLDTALAEALKGGVVFAKATQSLAGMMKLMEKADHPEMGKLVRVLRESREVMADVITIFGELKKATAEAIESR